MKDIKNLFSVLNCNLPYNGATTNESNEVFKRAADNLADCPNPQGPSPVAAP